MKHLLSRLLLVLVLLGGGIVPQTIAQTVIFHANTSVQPGEALSVQGNFSASAVVNLAPASSGSPQALPILVQRTGQATAQVPASLGLDVYQVWVTDQGQRSPSVWVNRAEGQHFDSPDITPGGRFRLFGRNLMLSSGAPQIRFAAQNGGGGSGQGQVTTSGSDGYKLQITAPTTLVPGTRYDVYVSNGRGPETLVEQSVLAIPAGADYFQLAVGWAPKLNFYGNIYNVRNDARLSRKAVGDGQTNDLPALQAAVDRASADGGGIVYVPAGTYRLVLNAGGGLNMRNRVVIRGDGMNQTRLQYGYGTPALDRWGLIWASVQQGGLADLTMVNVNESGQWMQNMTGSGTEVFMARVRYELSNGSWLWWAGSNKVLLRDCNFTQGVSAAAGFRGPVQLNSCTNFVVAGNSFTYAVDGINLNQAHEGVFENNHVYRDGSARYPTYVVNHVLVLNFAYNMAILNNDLDVINGPAQNSNDGEAIIAEGGGPDQIDEETGTVTAAWGNMLQDNNKGWGPARLQPVVAIVTGPAMGQWRNIVSRGGNALTLDRPWDVVPPAGSNYAIFNWGARNWVIQGNTLRGNRRGITIYHNATTDLAIVGNTLINSGSIDLAPKQISNNGMRLTPIYDTQVIGNSVANYDGSNGVFIGTHPVQHLETRTFGTSVVGLEVRRNTLTAHTPNTPAIVDDAFPEGYLNFLEFHRGGSDYIDEQIPGILGSIFQDNTAINCDNALYQNTGTYNTLVCNMNLVNSGNMIKEERFSGSSHTSVGTVSCLDPAGATLRAPENPANTAVGLNYQYYEGHWTQLPDFNALTPDLTGTATNFAMNMRRRNYGFGTKFTGFITVPSNGHYTFSTSSNDGSRIYIGNTLVVDNDGIHDVTDRSGTIGLEAGTHAITITYFRSGGNQTMDVSYLGPGVPKQPIPSAVLVRAVAGSAPALRNPENPAGTVAGLDYQYYEGSWNTLPNFNALSPTRTGTATDFSLSMRQRNDYFSTRYTGFITVPTDGQYTFYTSSDDGSKLYIGNTEIVNNDGEHYPQERSGTIGLKAGTHAFTVAFFQGVGGQTLDVSYQGPGISKQAVPGASLRRVSTTPAPTTLRAPENPAGTVAGLDYQYYEGSWNLLPNFSSLSPARTGTAMDFSLNMRQRNDNYATQYTGFVTVPADGQYTFYTSSDDGSKLYIGNTQVVNNDGLHGPQEQSGTIGLQAGTHAFTVTYFQGGGGQTLDVSYQGPGISKQAVPGASLRRVSTTNPSTLRAPENPAGTVAGLDYQYYEGSWNTLPNFSFLSPARTGTATDFSLNMRQRNDNYATQYTGFVTVPADGQYTFYTSSDDGSKLYIGNTQVVNNDGLHPTQEQSGTIGLQAGTHAFTVTYFQGGGGQTLDVSYQGPTLGKQSIPAAALRRVSTTNPSTLRVPENPSNTATGLDYQYYEGSWNLLPNFNALSPVRTGTANDFSLNMRQRNDNYATQYTGFVTVPADGQYTFYTSSDDGSKLYIGNTQVVNNDGVHPPQEQSGTIGLQAGTHAFTVTYFQGGGGQTLDVSYQGPGIGKQVIPTVSLRRSIGASRTAAPLATTTKAGSAGSSLQVYPNPSQGNFTVTYSAQKAQPAKLILTDGLGRTVKEKPVKLQAGINNLPFETENLMQGVYQLTLSGADGQKQVQKVMIVH